LSSFLSPIGAEISFSPARQLSKAEGNFYCEVFTECSFYGLMPARLVCDPSPIARADGLRGAELVEQALANAAATGKGA
jgi:hypothetical protein